MRYSMRYTIDRFTKSLLLIAMLLSFIPAAMASRQGDAENKGEKHISKVLFLGDSMAGWMAERLNAYGATNGFEVSTIVWDGSTIKKWAASPRLKSLIAAQKPDAVIIGLGMNELFEPNPAKTLDAKVDKIVEAVGDRPFLWIGPPSWPGHDKGAVLDKWLGEKLGEENYFSSFDLTLPRQSKTNPHPTREGIIQWMDRVISWIPTGSNLRFKSLESPGPKAMSRGKTFIYKRMRESL